MSNSSVQSPLRKKPRCLQSAGFQNRESKGGKGDKGGKGKGKKGWRKEEWFPQDGGRSQLSSEAADFIPSGLYDYDILSHQYWDMEDDTWREFADHEGTKYYYNCKTGLTQWERPAELDLPKPPPPPRSPLTSTPAVSQPVSQPNAVAPRKAKGEGKKGNPKKKDRKEKDEKNETSFGPPGCNLFVFHLPDEWGDDDMVEYFSPHGTIVSAKVMKELGTGRSRGFGFVSYEAQGDAAMAIRKMQGYKVLGKRLKVEFKKGEGEEEEKPDTKSSVDDERLIGYLRAISAQNVVQSLKQDLEVDPPSEEPMEPTS